MDDRGLLDEFVAERSQGAFRELVERHLPVVYSAARRMVRDPHLAEEVAQSVFITLAQKAGTIRPPQVLGGWLYNTTRHLAMHAIRTEQRRREREQTAAALQALHDASEDPPLTEHLEPALAALDAGDRDALVLRFLANRGLREVGEELGGSEDAARKRVSRALERLRALLEDRGVTATSLVLGPALIATTLPVPSGLGATIASAALSPAAAVAVAKVSFFTMKSMGAKVAVAAVVLTGVGAGTLAVQHWQGTQANSAAVVATPAPQPAATGGPGPTEVDSVSGLLQTPDGKPLAGVEILLSTSREKVPIYSDPPGTILSTATGPDGRFSFPASGANRAVIVRSDEGYAEATMAELAARPVLILRPWARVEGVLREGTAPQANQTIHLSRTRFGSKSQDQAYRTVHDTTTKTDGNGRYEFPRVAPGDTWISWRKNGYDVQYRYFHLSSGQALTADVGGRGQAVTGRAVLDGGTEPVKFYGSVWPKVLHPMPRPLNWSMLSASEQEKIVDLWEQTEDSRLFNQERCPIDFRVASDGSFTIPDLPTGEYRVVIASWTGAPMKSRVVSRGQAWVTISSLPGGRSDQVLDMGGIKAYFTEPLAPGDPAPLFELATLEGRPLKLADYKGRYVLLHFWRSDRPEVKDELPYLQAAQTKWGQDKRFVLIGINADPSPEEARRFARENGLSWTHCVMPEGSDLPAQYRIRGPVSFLIGSDGLIVQANLNGSTLADALQEALGRKE